MIFFEFLQTQIPPYTEEHLQNAYKAGAESMYRCIEKACTYSQDVLPLIKDGLTIFNMANERGGDDGRD